MEDFVQYSEKDLVAIIKNVVEQHLYEIDLDKAIKIAQACVEKAKSMNINAAISVCDKHGNAVLFYRMPNAFLVSSEVAYKKAYTSVSLNMTTVEAKELLDNKAFHLDTSVTKLVFFGGGIPIRNNGQLVGGIGVSGGMPEQDIEIAEYGINNAGL